MRWSFGACQRARPPSTTGAGLRMRRKFTQNRFGQSALVAVQQGLREVALVRPRREAV